MYNITGVLSDTQRKRKLEEIIDLNAGFCQTPPSAKKPRKRKCPYSLLIMESG